VINVEFSLLKKHSLDSIMEKILHETRVGQGLGSTRWKGLNFRFIILFL